MSKPIYDQKEMRDICAKYDFTKLLRGIATPGIGRTFEAEISADYNKRNDRTPNGEITIPGFVLLNAMRNGRLLDGAARDGVVDTTLGYTTGNGAALVQTDLLEDQYIHALAAMTVLGKAGIRILSNLRGDVAIPKGDTVAAEWFNGENGIATKVTPNFSQLTATPHTLGAHAEFTRRLTLQSSLAVQNVIATIITEAIARGIETAAFSGTGSSGQPLGLSGTSGVQSVTLDEVPTKAQLVEMWKKVFAENVHGVKCAYIGGAAMKGTLCQTLDIHPVSNGLTGDDAATVGAVTSGKYLCDGGKVEGYDYLTTNLCGDGLWFGDWENLMLCAWSGVDLLVDKYSLSTQGAIRLVALQDVDLVVRHPKAFVKATVSAE